MATKYIVDNVANQTISGNVTINGNLSVTGTTTGLATYKALLTQLGPQTGTTLNDFNDGLIIGETYTITDYQSGDDFSNIADVQTSSIAWTDGFSYLQESVTLISTTYNGVTGTTNGSGLGASFDVVVDAGISTNVNLDTDGNGYSIGDTITILGTDIGGSSPENDIIITVTELNPAAPNIGGCVFIATGEIPTNWNNGSTLESSGNLVVTVLENNLGFDIEWVDGAGFDTGIYFGFNSITGPLYNTFNRNTTFILGGGNPNPYYGPNLLETFIGPISLSEKDDTIVVAIFDTEILEPVSDSLYYFPVEIQVKQDTDTTPIVISGTVEQSFPIYTTSIDLRCNGNYIQDIYGDGTVNDMSELITYLNSESDMSYLGTYSDDGSGGVLLEMPTNLVNQFCSSGTLTFEVFNCCV
jgi:hypothetical protein